MIKLKRGRLIQAGTRGMWEAHKHVVVVSCPRCGKVGTLTDHTVMDDGSVLPSVQCPKCEFHDHIQLEGWGD